MDRKDAQMQKFLPALALSFAVQTAMAGDLPAGNEAAAPLAGGLMRANLVVPAQPAVGAQHGADPTALAANLQGGDDAVAKKEQERGREHTTGMLIAALALMVGIVLRRWGTDRQ